jgi:hypothetical protein
LAALREEREKMGATVRSQDAELKLIRTQYEQLLARSTQMEFECERLSVQIDQLTAQRQLEGERNHQLLMQQIEETAGLVDQARRKERQYCEQDMAAAVEGYERKLRTVES